MEFIRINNRNNFLLKEIPKHHPKSSAYIKFWKTHKRRCIEGFWSKDDANVNVDIEGEVTNQILESKGNWRYAPPNLYFYVNFGIILHKPDDAPKSAPKKKIKPLLRDVEWELYYNWLECRGFSGFKDDQEYSCNWELWDNRDNHAFHFDSTCYNSKGELKKFITPTQYLRQLHEKPLGIPLYQNMAKDLFWLSARGIGKSFAIGVGIILHELLFDGAKEYNEDSIKNPYKVEIFVGAAQSSKSADLLKKVWEAIENLPGCWGENTPEYEPSPFFKQMAGSLTPNNQKNPWRHEYLKKMGGSWKTYGSGSNIKHGLYTTENAEAAAGGRYSVMANEEVGLLANALMVQGSNTPTMQDPPWKFGSSVWIGTGGNVEKIHEFEIMFRDPSGFDALAFDDIWEGTGKIGWFVPCIYGMNDFKDENGNTNVEAAYAYKEKDRERKRKSKDPSALALEMMNFPFVPSEMFLNAKGSIFPQAELKAHLGYMKANPHKYENASYFVDLVWGTNGELEVKHLDSGNLVREFPIKDNKNKPGVIELFEMPKKDSAGNVYTGRYIQGTDTYDDDESSTNSLGSTFILDLWTSKITAEYTGRRGSKEFYEITRKLNIYYKADHNYEKNKKGLYTYYDQKNCTHLLCDTPESLRDVADINISKVGNQAKGTNASKQINAYGIRLILDWLLETAYGEDENSEIRNLHTIKSAGLVQELINFNETGNFDRCLLPGTQILTQKGYSNIEDLKIGDLVITQNGKLNKIYLTHKNKNINKIVKINILGQFNSLDVTINHPIWTMKSKKKPYGKNWYKLKMDLTTPEFKKAEELTKGDFVLIPKRKNLKTSKFNEDLLYLMGWYLSDGYSSKSSNLIEIFLHKSQYEIGIDLVNIINKYFERNTTYTPSKIDKNNRFVKSYYSTHKSKAKICLGDGKNQTDNMYIVSIHSKELKELLHKHCGKPKNKILSPELFNNKNLLPLLKGYYEGDGHYRSEIRCDGTERSSLEIATVFKELLLQIRQILIDEGIWSTIRFLPYSKKKDTFQDQYSLNITGQNCKKIIKDSKKFKQNISKRIVEKKHYIETKEGFWLPIKKIEEYNYEGNVYNISVEKDETYIANNILTHNCSALIMLMILKEEKVKHVFRKQVEKIKQITEDDFFSRNYNSNDTKTSRF